MFRDAYSFNQDIGGWNTGSALDFSGFFCVATLFNQNLNNWDVSSVTDFSEMFREASSFNQALDSWSTVSAQNFYGFFCVATAFNQNINSWDVSSVTDFSQMFQDATSFNQVISSWTVSSGRTFELMFDRSGFSQDLCDWAGDMTEAPAATSAANMFRDTPCPTTADPNLVASPISPLCYACTTISTNVPTNVPTYAPTTATSLFPVLGSYAIQETFIGDPTQGECWFVDIFQTETTQNPNTGCRDYTMEFSYHNGGTYYDEDTNENVDTGQPRENYEYVNVVATLDCDASPDVCTVSVAGVGTCNSCSHSDGYFTLTDCSNLPGVFQTGVTQVYANQGRVSDNENQFFILQFDQTRCDNYAFP